MIIDAIFAILPATTLQEILTKVNKRWRGESLELGDITAAISHLRKHGVKYGWTIPYVTGGAPTDDDLGRYFIVEVKPDGSRKRCSARNEQHLARGAQKVIKVTSTLTGNEAWAIAAVQPTLSTTFQGPARLTARHMHRQAAEMLELNKLLPKLIAA
jgi:hypothetical protein